MLASVANQRAPSSSASFTKSRKYHVFLSFRGLDTRSNFTGHLYSALCQHGINTFMDDDELRRGEEISSTLLTAIEDSEISVVVFSKNYASSHWCLDELVKILDCKESKQQLVIPVFYKVNPSDVRNHRGSFGDALDIMECKYKDNMENRWRAALSQATNLSGFTLLDEQRSEAKLIHKIVQEISQRVIDRTYLYVTEYPIGMHHPVQDIIKLLDSGENDVRMVGLWGTGGIGKTTIAKAVYNSIAHEFEGCSFLENIREYSTWQGGGLAKLQRTLLYEILRDTNLEVTNVHKGATVIKQRLSCRKVLLVLDDVDDMEQLHKLVGACDWFGVGSRIIITTRDKQLITAHHVNLIHEVKILDDPEALEVFCWHAFKRSEPPLGDYVKLAERAIHYAQGLPLALKVLGSCLCGGSIDKWEAALDGFKSTKIQDVLKISYDALDDERVKEVFLDLACFFKGKSRRYAIETLEACDLNPRYGIEVLIEKAHVSVEGDYIWMHDLLEEMGKDIVHQESPTEPGERSRLWSYEDIEHVLANNTGTNEITRIVLNSPEREDEIFLDVDCFSKMKNLKIFIIYNTCLYGDIHYLPNSLRVLDWHGCPFQSFPPKFNPKELKVLNMPRNCIKQLGEGLKYLTKLTSMNFNRSQFLTQIPDLSGITKLRYLNANGCRSLVEVHPSVGYLDKLEVLDFCDCHKLTKFPNKVKLKSLIIFRLYGCIKLESFPEIVDKMESLNELNLGRTAIKELPASIGHLIGLKKLRLFESAVKELPASIGHLTRLKELSLSASAIKELPSSIEHLTTLEELNLERTGIKKLPSSIGNFTAMKGLLLQGSDIKELPSSFGKLTALKALCLDGSAEEELPSSIGNLNALEELGIQGCENLANLPHSIYGLHRLFYINLTRCPKLVPLPKNNLISEVLSSAESLPLEVRTKSYSFFNGCQICWMCFKECNVSDTDSLENFGGWFDLPTINPSKRNFFCLPMCLSKIFYLRDLNLSGCKRLVEILVQLPTSTTRINMVDCISLERFSTLSKILEDGDMPYTNWRDVCNCHRRDGWEVTPSMIEETLQNQFQSGSRVLQMKRNKIKVKLPGSGSEVPEWFTFRNYIVKDTSEATYYELPIEIPWTSGLEKTKLVLCAVWEFTESFVSPCHLEFNVFNAFNFWDGVRMHCFRDVWCVSGGETGAGYVWLTCIRAHVKPSPIFRIVVYGKGLIIKSIGAHLDGDDDGK
ncbi:PREDICTED: TMV resistance protein N-like [Prunus mume]|uniref:TMV resistance protein N-like n=1 Tax=Prunus mume TaxID=102107 RepID=A0ABM1LKN8_PRUMU|nr:PREDICTED: TMV resistance protein N-like [Prunus mume]